MTSHPPLIRLNNISFSYPGRGMVLDHINLEINRGERIGLVGPNGSGKTTLFHIIMGLLKPTSGSIKIFGKEMKTDKDFKETYKKVGLLFQDADDQLFCPTVMEDVAFGPLNLGRSKDEAKAIARKTLAKLGIADFESRITHRLSGGEKRLVALATVLSMEPEVLLLDEPSTGLDENTKKTLIDVLNRLELSYILISHEIEFMSKITDAMYMMENGKIRTDVDVGQYTHSHPNPGHHHH
ncbi:energy-coupling factor ABC transporter ATP-binding protein [Desulfospira joergensenii]|uniref:energy-coupling factor ABC transporter ATP-binding protein n=1 Tax=Desulfospira joergensenii TaxID=53329 RepID=UPI00040CC0F5|nr:ABC transporter ATP-binding protein [Desulfospira joergensenii]